MEAASPITMDRAGTPGSRAATPGSVSPSQWLWHTFFQLIASAVSEKFARGDGASHRVTVTVVRSASRAARLLMTDSMSCSPASFAARFVALPWREKLACRAGQLDVLKQVGLDQFIHHPFMLFPCFYLVKETIEKPDAGAAAIWSEGRRKQLRDRSKGRP